MNLVELDILLVEDNHDDVELFLHVLQREQLATNILVARDGEEALDFLFCRGAFEHRIFERLPKLIMLDLKLPKVNGIEVLRSIKGNIRTKAIPVVIMTSSREERDLIGSYELGANSYIQKPVDFAEFRDTVRRVGLYWLGTNQPAPVNTASEARNAVLSSDKSALPASTE